MPKKPKQNYSDQPEKDLCQTPPYAVKPLMEYVLHTEYPVVWESCAGEGYLVRTLGQRGFSVVASDILTGQDYFEYEPNYYSIQITNPPYSLKYRWLARAYELGKPFALLMPSDTLFAKTAQDLFSKYGFSMLLPNRRIDFKMPVKGWDSNSTFSTSWFCWHIKGMPDGVTFVNLEKERPDVSWM